MSFPQPLMTTRAARIAIPCCSTYRHGHEQRITRAESFFFSSRRRHTRCGRDWSQTCALPIWSAARAITLDNAATDFVDRLLRNDATPTAVVTTEQAVTDELTDRLRAKWTQRHGGNARGGIAFLQKGMDVKPLGMNLRDLEFPDLRTISESRICMAMGRTPPILVGAKVGLDRSTFANYHEAVQSWWNGPLWSLQRRFQNAMSSKLLPYFVGDRKSV